jgi:hypothetical protein
MPYLCDIRSGSANNVIQVGGKLFVENVEFTPTNLAPVAFSQGPTAWGGAATAPTTYGIQGCGQLCLPRSYVRGSQGIYPQLGSAGQFDSTKIACGQDVESTGFVYSAAQARYYGVAGNNVLNTLSTFDNSFRVLTPGSVTGTAMFTNANNALAGWVFLPSQNSRWFTMQASSAFLATGNGLSGQIGGSFGVLTEAGTLTTVAQILRYPTMPYIGSDWVLVVGTPDIPSTLTDLQSSVPAYMCARNTGTLTTLSTNWLPATTPPAIDNSANYQLCFPSNAIVATPGSEIYFYQPTMSASVLNVWIGTVSNLVSTPTISPVSTAYTTAMIAGVDTTNDWITTSGDIPTLSRVRFTTSSTLPAPLALATDYWTIRITATTSRIATSYANAVANTYLDLTTQGTAGTLTTTAFATLNIDTSQVVFPGIPGSNIWRNVRAWTFVDGATKYLCLGVYEPGATSTVSTTALNLYLWRLDSKTSSTFLQKVSLGIAGRVRAIMPVDSAQKRLVIVYDDQVVFYAWNSSTNWTFQSAQPVQTQDVGIDTQGRVWVTTSGTYVPGIPAGYNLQSLNVYEPSGAATNITVSFQSSAYTYTGATISSNVIVSAYDTAGVRVALSVTLTRDTTNFDFSGNPSVVVTTSTLADTLVPISVFSTGLLSVLAVPT